VSAFAVALTSSVPESDVLQMIGDDESLASTMRAKIYDDMRRYHFLPLVYLGLVASRMQRQLNAQKFLRHPARCFF
jgi:hypothetical protein